jgi:ethanolamine transporter EutH
MNSKTSYANIVIINGLIAAAIIFVISIMYYVLGIDLFKPLFVFLNVVITFTVIIFFMVIGMKSQRDNLLDGKTNYGKKLLTGIFVSLIALVVSGVLSWLFYQLIDPDYISRQMEDFMMRMEDMGMFSEEQLSQMRAKYEDSSTPMGQMIQNLKSWPIIAVVFSLIVAAFVKNEKLPENEAF